jgi:CheY-like chemotaxis protein
MNRILVVEDDEKDADLLMRALAGNGLGITTCVTAPEARKLLTRYEFDAALVNLRLPPPESDGLDLIRWIRKYSTGILIVVVTGAEDPRRRAQAIEAGATGFFEKPYTSEDNRLLLHQLSANREAYRKGKQVKHRWTSIFGAIENIGSGLIGLSVVPSLTSMAAAEELKWVTIVGFILQIVGKQLFAAAAADAKTVNEHMQDCEPPHSPERQGNRKDIGLNNP